MKKFLDANRELWDAWARVHVDTEFYDVEGFLGGQSTLKELEIAELGDVTDKSLLHLQCHFGLDTLSWARRGARVTGVDFSTHAIELARNLARQAGLDARFVQADVTALEGVLEESFDVVFTSYGTITWLRDLDPWARSIAARLRPGGTFYMADFHPFLEMLDDDGRTLRYPYFHHAEPDAWDEQGSYADRSADVRGTAHCWRHPLGDVVSALIGAGLVLEFLHEHPYSTYDCFPYTEEIAPGRYGNRGLEVTGPMMYSIRARRPG